MGLKPIVHDYQNEHPAINKTEIDTLDVIKFKDKANTKLQEVLNPPKGKEPNSLRRDNKN